MTVETFANFATTTLTSNIAFTGLTPFTVTGGQGALFPAANFYVTIDTEILPIASRSGDTFTPLARGQDNSANASHSIGATVELAVHAGTFTALWSYLPASPNPAVAPAQLGNTPSTYDQEFDSAGSAWQFFPSLGIVTSVFTVGSSYLTLQRASSDNALYTAYVPYTATTSAAFLCRLSEGASYLRQSGDQAQVSFFVSDQTNPTAGADTGNRFKINTVLGSLTSTQAGSPVATLAATSRMVRAVVDTSGVATILAPAVPLSPGSPLFLEIDYDGAGTWTAFFGGDGLTTTVLAQKTGFAFTPKTLGLSFHVYNPSGLWVPQDAAVDYVRVNTSPATSGTVNGYYGYG